MAPFDAISFSFIKKLFKKLTEHREKIPIDHPDNSITDEKIANVSRNKITDLWASPFWSKIPDKPFSTLGSEFKVTNGRLEIASISRSKISDFFSTPFWNNIPDKPSQYPPEPHTHTRSEITDFWNSPFWENIPDKPSQYPPEPHTHTRSEITDFFSTPFWSEIPDKPFEGLGSEFSVDANKNLIVNQIDFSKITNRKISLIDVDTHFVPNADNAYDIGNSTYGWRNAWFKGTVFAKSYNPIENYKDYRSWTGNSALAMSPVWGNPLAFKTPYKVEYFDEANNAWIDITGDYDFSSLTDMKYSYFDFATIMDNLGVDKLTLRFWYNLVNAWTYAERLIILVQHCYYIDYVKVETSSYSDFVSEANVKAEMNTSVRLWDGALFIYFNSPIAGDNYIRITITIRRTNSAQHPKIIEFILASIVPPSPLLESILPFGWTSHKEIIFYNKIRPSSNNAYDLGDENYKWRNAYIAGAIDIGSLKVGGTEVIDSSRNIKNVNTINANEVYASSLVRVGDLEFRNGWRIVEDSKYGLVLVSPSGKKYRFKLEEVVE